MSGEAVLIRVLRKQARSRLLAHQIVASPNVAALEVELLLAEVLETTTDQLAVDSQRQLNSQELHEFELLLERRLQGEPIAYILGRKEFYSREFLVTPAVLIPRPETELLVDRVLHQLTSDFRHLEVIDIGTGSGNVIISVVCELRTRFGDQLIGQSKFLATDTSQEALEVAQRNMQRFGVSDYIQLSCSDLLTGVALSQNADLRITVSNPPYIADSAEVSKQVLNFEPHSALFSGADGLDAIKSLILQWAARPRVRCDVLILEIGQQQASEVESLLQIAGCVNYLILKDLHGVPRVVEVSR